MNQAEVKKGNASLDLAQAQLTTASGAVDQLLQWADCPAAAQSLKGVAQLISGGDVQGLMSASGKLREAMGRLGEMEDILSTPAFPQGRKTFTDAVAAAEQIIGKPPD